jgi:hypothetical protein
MVNLILIQRLGGWNSWVMRAAFDTRAACWLPRLHRPLFWKDRNGRKFQSLYWTKCDQVRPVQNRSLKIREHTLLSKLSFCSACDQFDCFLFRCSRSKSQTIFRTSQRTDRSSDKMPFWGMLKSLYTDYLIHWLFDNAVSNAKLIPEKSWRYDHEWKLETIFKSAKKPSQLTHLRIMVGRVYLVNRLCHGLLECCYKNDYL